MKNMKKPILNRLLAMALCLCIVLSICGNLQPVFAAGDSYDDALFSGDVDLTDMDLDNAEHFIIRHWHVVTEHAEVKSDTIIVEGYILPDGESYTFYARAYSPVSGVAYDDELSGFTQVTESTSSSYIRLVDGKLELMINPYHNGGEYYERFAGFSVSSGQSAVSITDGDEEHNYDGAKLTIDPTVIAPLIKSHVYYTNELLLVDGTTKYEVNGTGAVDFPDYIDTYLSGITKYYNSKAGLHTDKTAYAYADGRTFDLELEAWFSGARTIDVGMILDASGSMAYTMDTLEKKANTKIDVDSIIAKLRKSSDPNAQRVAASLSKKKLAGAAGATIAVKDANILTTEELSYILNTKKTDASPLGINGYTYFVYDGRSSVHEYVPLAYWEGGTPVAVGGQYAATTSDGTVIGALGNGHDQFRDEGWYYVNFTQKLPDNYLSENMQSGKALWGIFGTGVSGYADGAEFNLGKGLTNTNNNTGAYKYSYTCKNWTAMKFIIGVDGKLCAFFDSEAKSDGKQGVSYVYENPDSSYTKVEALQRAVGTFSTKLFDAAPNSKISAVRFSTPDATSSDYDKFVLLNWTDDAPTAAKMLSVAYGTGGTVKGDTANGMVQYNYGLTGGTATHKGLDAFQQKLAGLVGKSDKKYIIIFTDGRDSVYNSLVPPTAKTSEAYKIAEELKEQGYTIFTALLATGTVANGMGDDVETEDHRKATVFLKALASDPSYFFEATDADSLVRAFSRDILGAILDDLDDYNVQDYIDPRFDLVDADDVVWHLNADGKVVAGSDTYDLAKGDAPVITLSDAPRLTESAAKATLHYDSENSLYYLVWEEQNVPGSKEGAARLGVWRGRITVRAKEDFIGGNAVLTNGNSDTQNYVYKMGEESSSGIDMSVGGKDDNPSKGFPRTTVNVKILEPGVANGSDDFYKGETPEEFLKGLLISLTTSDSKVNPYWDYFVRYWNRCNSSDESVAAAATALFIEAYKNALGIPKEAAVELDLTDFGKFIDAIVEALCGPNHTFTLPYSYLPDLDENSDQVNQTGTQAHEDDVLGDLIFNWDWESKEKDSGTLSVTFAPDEPGDRAEDTNDLIDDGDYQYDSGYKPTVGTKQGEVDAAGGYMPEYVPGELALKFKANAADLKWLFSDKGDWKGATEKTFTVTVKKIDGERTRTLANGETTMTVTVTKPADNATGYVYFYADNLAELDKGTYTMTFANGEGMYGKHVTATFRLANTGEYPERFTGDGDLGVSGLIAPNYPAENAATFELGSNEDAQADNSYLNDRFGMAVIDLTVDHGVLIIRKEFADTPVTNEKDALREFEFVVSLYEDASRTTSLTAGYEYQVYGADGNPIEGRSGTIVSGGSVVLKAGEYVMIDGLPEGAGYVVTEKDSDGFTATGGKTVSGVITTAADGTQEALLVFNNKKTREPVYVSVYASKILTGLNAPKIGEGDYSFRITPVSGNPENDPLKGGLTVKNGAPGQDGSALIKLLEQVKYVLPDDYAVPVTYRYTVTEEKGDIPGVVYSTASYTVTVVIDEEYIDGKYTGKLEAKVYVDGNTDPLADPTSGKDIQFENTFDQNARVKLDGLKTVDGGKPDKSFQFKLEYVNDGTHAAPEIPSLATVTSDRTSGAFSFGEIIFTEEGVYTFIISEVKENNTGYVLAEDITVVVTVTRNSVYNILQATVKVNGQAVVGTPASAATIQVSANNKKLPEYTLEVAKEVGGLLGDREMPFEFTITLTKPDELLETNFPLEYALEGSAAAAYGGKLTFQKKDGVYVATISLKHNQNLIIKGLLAGTGYTVEETNYEHLGYITRWYTTDSTDTTPGRVFQNEEGIGEDASVTFRNLNPAGSVSITKEVSSPESSDKNKAFSFLVTIEKPSAVWSDEAFKTLACKYTVSDAAGIVKEGSLVLIEGENGVFVAMLSGGKPITLTHGQTIHISGLPAGATVHVTEVDAGGFTPKLTNNGQVVVPDQKEGDAPIEILVHNERDVNNLTVSKKVKGNEDDKAEAFTFTVTLKDSAGNQLTGEYAYVTTGTAPAYAKFTSGASFTLKHGETFTIQGLPTGTVYVVEEASADGYRTTVNGDASNSATGVIKKDVTVRIEYENERVSDPVKRSDPVSGTMRWVGSEIIYTVTWENYKNGLADVTIVDELDPGLDYVEGTAKAYRYNAETDTFEEIGDGSIEDHVLTWTLSSQPALSYGYVVFTVVVNENAVVSDHGNMVYNDALVQVGNDSWVRTNEVEHPIFDPEKTEVTPGAGKVVLPGSEITYEITWENYKDFATGVIITDPLDVHVAFVRAKIGAAEEEGEWYTGEDEVPGIVYDAETHTVIWTLEDVEAKAFGTVTLVVRVLEEATVAGFVENQAFVQVDNDPAVETAIIENRTPLTEVTIFKEQAVGDGERTVERKRVVAGDIVTYYVTVTNIGDIAVNGLIVTDRVPDGLLLVEGSISHGGTEIDGVVTWDLGTLAAGEAVTVSFRIKVPAVEKNTSWLNIAMESHENPEDPDKPPFEQPSNEVEIEAGEPELTIHKTQAVGDGEQTTLREQVEAGDSVTYYLTVKNIGNGTASHVVLTDEIPAGLTLVEGSISHGGKLLADGKTIVWQLGSMEPGDTVTVSFRVIVPSVTEQTVWENVALLSYSNPNDEPSDPNDPDDPSDPSDPGDSNDPDDSGDPHRDRTRVPSNKVEIEEPVEPKDSPQTGDHQNLQLWFVLFGISCAGLLATGAMTFGRKSRKQK